MRTDRADHSLKACGATCPIHAAERAADNARKREKRAIAAGRAVAAPKVFRAPETRHPGRGCYCEFHVIEREKRRARARRERNEASPVDRLTDDARAAVEQAYARGATPADAARVNDVPVEVAVWVFDQVDAVGLEDWVEPVLRRRR